MKAAHPHAPAQAIASLWDSHHFSPLDKAHLRHQDIQSVLDEIAEYPAVTRQTIGYSCAGKSIERLSIGQGPLIILTWTQMHGDEPTATAAVLDWLKLLHLNASSQALALDADWTSLVTLHVIPMLNPDGDTVIS